MRTNIDIDDDLMDGAMRAGHFKTKKEAVEAGLKLLARQAAYQEILKWEGKLQWDADEEVAPSSARTLAGRTKVKSSAAVLAREPAAKYEVKKPAAKKATHGRR